MNSEQKALAWQLYSSDRIEEAANAGIHRANHMIGNLYHGGDGVNQNDEIALSYYRKSARHGNVASKRRILEISKKSILGKILYYPRLAWLMVQVAIIASRDIHDERLLDIRRWIKDKKIYEEMYEKR